MDKVLGSDFRKEEAAEVGWREHVQEIGRKKVERGESHEKEELGAESKSEIDTGCVSEKGRKRRIRREKSRRQ